MLKPTNNNNSVFTTRLIDFRWSARLRQGPGEQSHKCEATTRSDRGQERISLVAVQLKVLELYIVAQSASQTVRKTGQESVTFSRPEFILLQR
jgi:hypothetical protein